MASKTQNVKLGIFLVATAVLSVLILAYVGGRTFWEDANHYYVASNETISGIDPGSPVTMYGVKVGEVESIELDRENFDGVRLTLAIDEDVKVPVGARAYMESMGLTGLKQVDISGGDLARGVQPPGTYLERGESDLEALQREVKSLLPEVEQAVAHADELLVTLNELAGAVKPHQVEGMVTKTDTMLDQLVATSGALEETVSETRPRLRTIMTNLDEATERAGTLMDNADRATADANAVVKDANELVRDVHRMVEVNEDDVRATMYNLRRTSHNAEQLSRELRNNPSRLLFSEHPAPRKLP